jgi:hypothetical protein
MSKVIVLMEKGQLRLHVGACDFSVGNQGQLYVIWPDCVAGAVHAPGTWLYAAVKPDEAETSQT